MSAARSDLLPNIVLIPIGTQASAISLPGLLCNRHSRIKSVSLINQATVALNATNFATVSLEDAANNVVASVSTATQALTALTPQACPLNTSNAGYQAGPSEIDLAEGTVLKVVIAEGGTGAALTDAVLQVEMYPV